VKLRVLTVVTLILLGIGALLNAQQAGFKRTVLQQVDASVPGREACDGCCRVSARRVGWEAYAPG